MPEPRYLPRKLPIVELIGVLVEEHAVMKEGLLRIGEATARKDFTEVSRTLKRLDLIFRQHIVDEEAQILRLLVGELGRKGAEEEIRVFQQHRPIYRLMQEISKFASMPAAELQQGQKELRDLFEKHAFAEERRVFPRAERLSAE